MARPGIMLYFEILEPIRVLPDADKGRLLVAMLEYGQSGVVPDFDGNLGLTLAWGFVKPKIDLDEEAYNMSVLRRQYATACRERKRKGEPDITFDEWIKTHGNYDNHLQPMIINDNQCFPSTSTSTPTITSSTPSAAATTISNVAANAAAEDSVVKALGGELGKNVVFLSNDQIADLLDQMDIETFNYYVDKLSRFIIQNNARVMNHYETILKWWHEDGIIPEKGKKADNYPKGATGKLGELEMAALYRTMSES